MQDHQIKQLLKKYNAGTCTDAERALIEDWYLQFEQKNITELSEQDRQADLDRIWAALPVHGPKTKMLRTWYRIAAAAIILIMLSIGVYTLSQSPDQEAVLQALNRTTKPGGNKAVLTLNDGTQISLTDAADGQLASQSNTAIVKTANGNVAYKVAGNAGNKALMYNTLATPLGGTYNLTLADGTKVSLDAGSSIRFPVMFAGNERRVEVTGQVYFEVAHNKTKPFRVSSNGQTIEVLGTHFNVNAYTDEGETKTTLLEGSININTPGEVALLVPGQQATVARSAAAIKVKNVDTAASIAWKKGVFAFKRDGLQLVMRQFSRWYNVDVVYEGDVPNVAITGKVQRTANASQVLKIVNNLGIKFKVEGRKITILHQ